MSPTLLRLIYILCDLGNLSSTLFSAHRGESIKGICAKIIKGIATWCGLYLAYFIKMKP